MKTNKFSLWLLALLMLTAAPVLTACSDDDDNNGKKTDPDGEEVIAYDDLAMFQNAICLIDSAGQLVRYHVGQALYDSEPQHLYIGADNIEEAARMFSQWIAPDVELPAISASTTELTAQLTDTLGHAQGTIYFRAGTGTTVAEVTASASTQLRYIDKITFLQNSAWPYNSGEVRWHKGDIITYAPTGDCGDALEAKDKALNWVLIREAGNGVNPMWCAITNEKYHILHYSGAGLSISKSSYCPALSTAKTIANILQSDWDFFVSKFNEAGSGKLYDWESYWTDHSFYNSWLTPYYTLYMYSNHYTHGGQMGWDGDYQPFLLKIDWLGDGLFPLKPTAGSAEASNPAWGYSSFFDGQNETKWCVSSAVRTEQCVDESDGKCWFVEFETDDVVTPKGYYMTTSDNTNFSHYLNPETWKLYGKKRVRDKWTLMDSRSNDNSIPSTNYTKVNFTLNGTAGEYQYFRLEILHSGNNAWFQMAEFGFTY